MDDLNRVLASLDCNKGKEPFNSTEEKLAAINEALKGMVWSDNIIDPDRVIRGMVPDHMSRSEAEVKLLRERKAMRDGRLYIRLWRRFMEWVRA